MSDCPCSCSKCVLGGKRMECHNPNKKESLKDKLLNRSKQVEGGGAAVQKLDGNVGAPECRFDFDEFLIAKAAISALTRKNSEFQSEFQKRLSEKDRQMAAKDMEMAALTNRANSFQEMIYNMRDENSRLNRQIHEARNENEETSLILDHFRNLLQRQDEEMRQILTQLRDQDEEMRRLQNKNQEITDDINRFRQFQTEACELAKENMALKTRNAMLMNQFLDMQLRVSAATGESRPKENEEVIECLICMENPRTVVFTKCGHVSCCEGCSDEFNSCQLCREKKNKDDLTNGYSSFVRLPTCCTCKQNMPDMWCSNCKHISICFDCSNVSSASSASSHPTCANCNQTGKLTKCFFS